MEETCHITNRSASLVAYALPERHILREIYPGEKREVPVYEITELANQPGGRELIMNFLYIQEKAVIDKILNIQPEPEYYFTADTIDDWMKTCSLDAFKDALDFAPEGVKDLIRSHAVSLPLNDIAKCEAVKAQLGFDVLAAIKHEKETTEEDGATAAAAAAMQPKARRATITPGRRETPNKE